MIKGWFERRSDAEILEKHESRYMESREKILSQTSKTEAPTSNVALASRVLDDGIRFSVNRVALRHRGFFGKLNKPMFVSLLVLSIVCLSTAVAFRETQLRGFAVIAVLSQIASQLLWFTNLVLITIDLFVQLIRSEVDDNEKSNDDSEIAAFLKREVSPQALKVLKDRQDDTFKLAWPTLSSSVVLAIIAPKIISIKNVADFTWPVYFILLTIICLFYVPLAVVLRRSIRKRGILTLSLDK